jgi:hypothetical protein
MMSSDNANGAFARQPQPRPALTEESMASSLGIVLFQLAEQILVRLLGSFLATVIAVAVKNRSSSNSVRTSSPLEEPNSTAQSTLVTDAAPSCRHDHEIRHTPPLSQRVVRTKVPSGSGRTGSCRLARTTAAHRPGNLRRARAGLRVGSRRVPRSPGR